MLASRIRTPLPPMVVCTIGRSDTSSNPATYVHIDAVPTCSLLVARQVTHLAVRPQPGPPKDRRTLSLNAENFGPGALNTSFFGEDEEKRGYDGCLRCGCARRDDR